MKDKLIEVIWQYDEFNMNEKTVGHLADKILEVVEKEGWSKITKLEIGDDRFYFTTDAIYKNDKEYIPDGYIKADSIKICPECNGNSSCYLCKVNGICPTCKGKGWVINEGIIW